MKKRILGVILCLALLTGVLSAFAGCSSERTSAVTAADAKAQTLVIAAIKDERTTDEAILAVQDALNEITESSFNTHIVLKLFTAEEYAQKVLELSDKLAVKQQEYENGMSNQGSSGSADTRYDLIDQEEKKDYVTLPNGDLAYYDEFGREITVYPAVSEDQIDVVFIDSLSTYYKLLDNEYIINLTDTFDGETDFDKYVNTTLMNHIYKVGNGLTQGNSTFAVPNNYVIDSYRYILVNKKLYDHYNYDIKCDVNVVDTSNKDGADDLTDFIDYLNDVMANNDTISEDLKVDKILYNYSPTSTESYFGTSGNASIILPTTKLFSFPSAPNCDSLYSKAQFRRTESLIYNMKKLGMAPNMGDCFYLDDEETIGYKAPAANFADNEVSFALAMVSGDKAVESYYNQDDYYVVKTNVPVVRNEMFDSMFAVSTFSSTAVDMDGVSISAKIQNYSEQYNPRCVEIINMLQTNAEAVNLLTYGVETKDYDYSSAGTVYNTGKSGYYPVIGKMGNLFLTYPSDVMDAKTAYYAKNDWRAAKEQNAAAIVSPYCGFMLRDEIEDELSEVSIKPSEIVEQLGIAYEDYQKRISEYDGDDIESFIRSLNSEFVSTDAYKYAVMMYKIDNESGTYYNLILPFAQFTWFYNLVNKGEGSYFA